MAPSRPETRDYWYKSTDYVDQYVQRSENCEEFIYLSKFNEDVSTSFTAEYRPKL